MSSPDQKKLRAVVVGCGRMGTRPSHEVIDQFQPGWLPISHAEALSQNSEFELVGLCDTNPYALEVAALHYPNSTVSTNLQSLIQELKPDIVSIATRTPVKKELIQYLAPRVRGLYVEKPIANSLADWQRIRNLIQDNKVSLVYGVNRRYHANYILAKELLARNTDQLGRLMHIHVDHGRGRLLWTHPHSVDLFCFFSDCNEIESIQARCVPVSVELSGHQKVISDPIVDFAFVEMRNSVTGSIGIGGTFSTHLHCENGTIIIHSDGLKVELQQRNQGHGYFSSESFNSPQISVSATARGFRQLADSIQLGAQPPVDHIEAGMTILTGMIVSHLKGVMPVSVAEIPEYFEVLGKTGENFA